MKISISRAMPDDRNCQVIEQLDVRPLRGRRGWSAEAKARLVCPAPGANVSAIARREGMAPSQLFGWRRKVLHAEKFADARYGIGNPVSWRRRVSDLVGRPTRLPVAT